MSVMWNPRMDSLPSASRVAPIRIAWKQPLVRIGAIGDMSCFYHSVCQAVSPVYQVATKVLNYAGFNTQPSPELIYRSRQQFVDRFRRSLVQWLLQPGIDAKTGKVHTSESAVATLNSDPAMLRNWFERHVRDPSKITFPIWSTTIGRQISYGPGNVVVINYLWAHHVYEELFNGNPQAREDMLNWLVQSCVLRNSGISGSREHLLRALDSGGCVAEEIQRDEAKFITCCLKATGGDPRYYPIYRRKIIDGLAVTEDGVTSLNSVDDILVLCLLQRRINAEGKYAPVRPEFVGFIEQSRTYIRARLNRILYLRELLGNRSLPSYESYSKLEVDNIFANFNPDTIWQRVRASINSTTGNYFTEAEIKWYQNLDPRIGLIDDPDVLRLPVNLNYFLLNGGSNIRNYQVVSGLQLQNLITQILPIIRYGVVISRRDAGLTDIITLIPYILKIDLYIVEVYLKHLQLYGAYYTSPSLKPSAPSIVIHSTPGHFEVIGVVTKSGIQTIFEPNHALIQQLHCYSRLEPLLEAAPG